MKLSDATTIAVTVYLALFIVISVWAADLCTLTEENLFINDVLDSAAFDVATCMIEYDESGNVCVNKEQAEMVFFKSLSAYLGIYELAAERIGLFVPVMVIVCEDGFYVSYEDIVTGNEGTCSVRTWSDKIPYSFMDNGWVYCFSLGGKKDYVRVLNLTTGKILYGHYKEVMVETGLLKPNDEDGFNVLRKSVVADCIQKKIQYYINRHNVIAKRYGLQYSFYLPSDEADSALKTIDEVSFLYVFQGYPYRSAGDGYFNRIAFAGADVSKKERYYVDLTLMMYHRKNCSQLHDYSCSYLMREECASVGAYPCPECIP